MNELLDRNPVGAQFMPYHALKSSILNWRNQTLPPLPSHLSQIAEALQYPEWQGELLYEMSYANEDTGSVEVSEHQMHAWAVDSNSDECHVVFGTPTYAAKFMDMDVAYMDSTYDSVPNTEGAYQLLTVLIEYNGQVSLRKELFVLSVLPMLLTI